MPKLSPTKLGATFAEKLKGKKEDSPKLSVATNFTLLNEPLCTTPVILPVAESILSQAGAFWSEKVTTWLSRTEGVKSIWSPTSILSSDNLFLNIGAIFVVIENLNDLFLKFKNISSVCPSPTEEEIPTLNFILSPFLRLTLWGCSQVPPFLLKKEYPLGPNTIASTSLPALNPDIVTSFE